MVTEFVPGKLYKTMPGRLQDVFAIWAMTTWAMIYVLSVSKSPYHASHSHAVVTFLASDGVQEEEPLFFEDWEEVVG